MKNMFSLFIEDLTILDCAIWHPLRGAIGYSWIVGIEFIGATTDEGVVFDFSLAKKFAKKIIDSTADHGFICPTKHTQYIGAENWTFEHQNGFYYNAPTQAFMVLDIVNTESIVAALQSKILEKCLMEKDCGTLEEVRITLTEENDKDAVYFNYVHGLKQHYGNCQRLIHGHRSTIKVWINEERSPVHEKYLAALYHDKHLAIADNTSSEGDIIVVEYEAKQGKFTGRFDANKVLILPYETTIENISKFSAETLKNDFPELRKSVVTVAAYEGIGKGSKYTLDQSYKIQKLEEVLTEGLN